MASGKSLDPMTLRPAFIAKEHSGVLPSPSQIRFALDGISTQSSIAEEPARTADSHLSIAANGVAIAARIARSTIDSTWKSVICDNSILARWSMPKTIFTGANQFVVEVVKETHLNAGFRQEDLALRLGRDQSWISLIESSQRRLDVVEFIEIARALDADPVGARRILDVFTRGPCRHRSHINRR